MKAKIFVGPPQSGKTRVADMISEFVGKDKTFFMSGRSLSKSRLESPFLFSEMKEETGLLIIDDCLPDFDFSIFIGSSRFESSVSGPLFKFIVNAKNKPQKEITISQIIFTMGKLDPSWLGSSSFLSRFDIVNFPLSPPYNFKDAQIINNEHPCFGRLMYVIEENVRKKKGCRHDFRNLNIAFAEIEKWMKITIDKSGTTEYLKNKGGFCDCEILMNAQFA